MYHICVYIYVYVYIYIYVGKPIIKLPISQPFGLAFYIIPNRDPHKMMSPTSLIGTL